MKHQNYGLCGVCILCILLFIGFLFSCTGKKSKDSISWKDSHDSLKSLSSASIVVTQSGGDINQNDMDSDKLSQAIRLRSEKKFAEAEAFFKQLVEEYPDNAKVFYHYAWLCDNMERESEARPKYEKALELGLTGDDLKGCYLGLGSTYRCIGEYEKSIALFDKAIHEFPKNNEYKVFKAMALYNIKEPEKAIHLLLSVIAQTSNDKGIQEYRKAIEYYSDKLDKTFY